MKVEKKILSFITVLSIVGSSVASAFSDLGKEHWAYEKVELMQEKGIISGFEDETFRPDEKVTREQFASILVKSLRLNSSSNEITFEDVDANRWSKEAIELSSQYLTAYESDGKYYFRPEEPAVREDMAVAVVKAKGLQNEVADYQILDKFSDKNLISESTKKYVVIAVEHGFMNGNADGTFNPLGSLTRAEVTALMYNVMDKIVLDDIITNDGNSLEMPKFDGKILNLGNDWEKFEIATDRATKNGRGGGPGDWYTPAGKEVTLDKLYTLKGNVYADTTAQKIFVKYNGEIIKEFNILENQENRYPNVDEPEELLPNFQLNERNMTIDFGKEYAKYEVSYGRDERPGAWYKVKEDFNNPYTIVTKGTKLVISELEQVDNINYVFVRLVSNHEAGYRTIEIPSNDETEKLPNFQLNKKDMTIDFGKEYAKYEVSYGRDERPGVWYKVKENFNNPYTIVTKGTKLFINELDQADNINYIFVRLSDNHDVGYRTIEVDYREKEED